MKYLFITFSILSFAFNSCSQKDSKETSIAFYNTENLFDTIDDKHKNDNEFLPNGKKEWNSQKYWEKIEHINKVVKSMNYPIILGLCEIENKAVVQDVIDHGEMKENYDIIHFESTDQRGIDNAIVYDKSKLEVINSGFVRFDLPSPRSHTRDIVWAKFKKGNTTFITMVNHWPSRWGGQVKSEPKRLVAANAAKEFIDSVLLADPKMKFVFMGDLNDYPTNLAPQMISSELTPVITEKSGEHEGTHNYRGEWGVLDHIMITSSMTKKGDLYIKKKSGIINEFDYLLTTYKGNIVPFRTYGGGKYLGGYSDHLPVSVGVILR